MKDFFLKVWEVISFLFGILIGPAVFLYFSFQCVEIKDLQKEQIAASEQIVETQVALYDTLVDTKAAEIIIDTQLAKGIDQAKADAIKNKNELMQVIYGVDKRSIDRSQGIVDGVNKVVNDVSYVLQKPSYDYLKNITVILLAHSNDPNAPDGKKGWLGTGIIIGITDNYTYILTNRHVVAQFGDGEYSYYAKAIPGKEETKYPFEVVKVSKDDLVDLALIRVAGKIEGKTAVIGLGQEPKPQDPVYLVGHNLGRPYLYDEGTVAGYDDIDLVVNMPTGPGNSGSGVINKDGSLVGLLYAGSIISQEGMYQMDTGHGLCVDIKHIRLFLAGLINES